MVRRAIDEVVFANMLKIRYECDWMGVCVRKTRIRSWDERVRCDSIIIIPLKSEKLKQQDRKKRESARKIKDFRAFGWKCVHTKFVKTKLVWIECLFHFI